MNKQHFIYETIFFFLLIIGISFQIILTVLFNQINLSSIDSIVTNWKGGPVIDLLSNKQAECNSDASVLENQLWKGTVSGGRNYLGKIIRMGSNATSFGVNAIPSIPEQKITTWKNIKLCGHRMNIESYFHLEIVSPEQECSPLHKKCGGVIDSLGNHLCIINEEKCPVNHIEFLDYSHPYKDNENYLLFRDGFIYYSNEINKNFDYDNKFILKDLTFSEGIPCIDQDYINATDDDIHILDYYYKRTKCPFQTQSSVYNLLDSYSKEKFYQENNITQKLKTLPEYKAISPSSNISIYFRSYAGIRPSCLSKINDKKAIPFELLTLKANISKCLKWSTVAAIVDIVAFLLILANYSANITKIMFQKEKRPKYTKPGLMIATIFSLIFSCVLIANITTVPHPLIELFENSTCVDENTFALMNPLTIQLYIIKIIIWIMLSVKIVITLKYGMMRAIKYAS